MVGVLMNDIYQQNAMIALSAKPETIEQKHLR
jgi:hypothetical protein